MKTCDFINIIFKFNFTLLENNKFFSEKKKDLIKR